ncbi:MAG: hypothetical protein PHF99_12900, partial [Bacteroidales bacterium]|nr:hypothetical protein [Bacteroidales bacterium]
MRKIFYSLSLVVLSLSVFAQVWNDDINGLDSLALNPYGSGQVYDLLNFNDSILYIGGAFYTVNNQLAKSFASWNTDTVTTYQQGVEIGGVYTITTYHDTLYIGGSFTSASENPNTAYLAVWNGSNWQSISIGQPGGEVRDFCIFHDTLFITGNFNTIGGIDYNKIAAYNGEEWINVGGLGHWSKALAVFNDELYAGGFWGVKRYLGGDEWELFDIVPNGY